MDGLPTYHQPSNPRWMKLLFLTTGFIIGGMCLWAFVQKQANRQSPSRSVALSTHDRSLAVLPREATTPETSTLPIESPARAAIHADKLESIPVEPVQEAQRVSYETTDLYPMVAAELPVAQPQPIASQAEYNNPAVASLDTYPLPAGNQVATAHYQEPVAIEQHQPAKPIAAQPISIETKRDDSFWQIADRVYGDPRYYRALFEFNRNWIAYPDQIEQGFQVMTPSIEELRARYPGLCPGS